MGRSIISLLVSIALCSILCSLLFCGSDTVLQSSTTVLAPQITWKSGAATMYPDAVTFVRITVSYDDVSKSNTFPFTNLSGTIEDLPSGKTVTVLVEGLATNGNDVLYAGTKNDVLLSGSVVNVPIDASEVTPLPVDSISIRTLTSSKILIAWFDRATNEKAFNILRRVGDQGDFVHHQMIPSSTPVQKQYVTFIDSDLQPSTVYTYKIVSFNDAGTSTKEPQLGSQTFVNSVNNPPYFLTTPLQLSAVIKVGERYIRPVKSADDDGDALTFAIKAGITLVPTRDTIIWMPQASDIGLVNRFWIRVTDTKGAKDSLDWNIVVRAQN